MVCARVYETRFARRGEGVRESRGCSVGAHDTVFGALSSHLEQLARFSCCSLCLCFSCTVLRLLKTANILFFENISFFKKVVIGSISYSYSKNFLNSFPAAAVGSKHLCFKTTSWYQFIV